MPGTDNYAQNVPYPKLSDQPNIESSMSALVNGAVALSNMTFANANARAAAIQTPVVGMETYLIAEGRKEVYTGTGWTPLQTSPSWTTFTPTVTGGGSATFATRTGQYLRFGPLTFVMIYLVVGAAGSGTDAVSVTMPTAVDRSMRQLIPIHTESIGGGGNASSHIGGGEVVFFVGGSGGASDRIRIDEGGTLGRENNITGVDLLSGGLMTIQGWYL